MKTTVIVTLSVMGLHRWPEATGEIAFLAGPHLHTFLIRLAVEVSHDNREWEFLQLRRDGLRAVNNRYPKTSLDVFDFGRQSCEQIAGVLLEEMPMLSWAEVWEEGDFGARAERVS